jgi:hypothetical protein
MPDSDPQTPARPPPLATRSTLSSNKKALTGLLVNSSTQGSTLIPPSLQAKMAAVSLAYDFLPSFKRFFRLLIELHKRLPLSLTPQQLHSNGQVSTLRFIQPCKPQSRFLVLVVTLVEWLVVVRDLLLH